MGCAGMTVTAVGNDLVMSHVSLASRPGTREVGHGIFRISSLKLFYIYSGLPNRDVQSSSCPCPVEGNAIITVVIITNVVIHILVIIRTLMFTVQSKELRTIMI